MSAQSPADRARELLMRRFSANTVDALLEVFALREERAPAAACDASGEPVSVALYESMQRTIARMYEIADAHGFADLERANEQLAWVRGAKDEAEKAREQHWRDLERARAALGSLRAWSLMFGAALKPIGADTFGEGMRESKRQVAAMLDAADAVLGGAAGERLCAGCAGYRGCVDIRLGGPRLCKCTCHDPAAQPSASVAGDRCESGNECGRIGCPECQQ